MTPVLHIVTTIVTLVFVAAVLYSLYLAYRKHQNKSNHKKDLETKEHVKVDNLHQYDIQPHDGYYKYPVDTRTSIRRYPQRFTAVSVALANDQPYSICLIAFASYDHGELKDSRYFYVRPPENDLSHVDGWGIQWDEIKKADEFGEYWNAGMSGLFTDCTLVAHNAPYVFGCITHALAIYGIKAPEFRYIDTLEVAKAVYHFDSNQLPDICDEMGIEHEEHNVLHEAIATGKFLAMAKKDYPMYLPRIYYTDAVPSEEERLASLISTVEREECTATEMFTPAPVDNALIQTLLDKKYIEPGKKQSTYYATDAGLDFAESIP
jgi:DNA polymerase III epsilon subunit-like protein